MSSPQTTATDLSAVVDALRGHERFVVTTHENPDGDALGSLLAAKLAFDELGKDSVMVLYGDAPLPGEYQFMPLAELGRRWPDDVSERSLVALDCANESRIADPDILGRVPFTINIDHHHDNTRFGDLDLVIADASSTGEIVRDLLRELGVELTPEIAEALYIALVTDTGRFQYTNTTPKALRLAAELVEAGAAGAYSEGIIDYLRAVGGADMAALIREPPRSDGPARRVSLRSSDDELDVSAIARLSGGGGHRQAAGFSSDASIEE